MTSGEKIEKIREVMLQQAERFKELPKFPTLEARLNWEIEDFHSTMVKIAEIISQK